MISLLECTDQLVGQDCVQPKFRLRGSVSEKEVLGDQSNSISSLENQVVIHG